MKISIFLLVLASAASTLSPARGNMTFNLTPSSDGGVRVVGSGSGNVTGITNAFHYDIFDFNADFLSDSLGTVPFAALATSGFLRNNSTGVSASIYYFFLDRDPNSTDNIAFETRSNQPYVTFNGGDSFSFQVAATFSPSYIKFSDLKLGSYSDTVKNTSTEIFGTISLIVAVPEPHYGGMALGGFLMLLLVARVLHGRRQLITEVLAA